MTPEFLKNPILLAPDNFTPLVRTPWAGNQIGQRIKNKLVPSAVGQRIGESWEFSCDPTFPSQVPGAQCTLPELVARYPEDVLSPAAVTDGHVTCEILLKIINVAEPLSLQVHPDDENPHLKVGECGKPESWLILDREPGAGIYLGFSRSLGRDELRQLLLDGDRAKDVLQFIPVEPGDYFDLAPGVPHAIGAGITLLEPQRIKTGFSGKTYRLWDWGRRYNVSGLPDVAGQPRELHIEESLRIINPRQQVGQQFVATIRRHPRLEKLTMGSQAWFYPENNYYQLVRIRTERKTLLRAQIQSGYGAAVVLQGQVMLEGAGGHNVTVLQGQPLLLPYRAWPLTIQAEEPMELAIVVPRGARFEFLLR